MTATGNPSLFTYSLTNAPAGVSINSNSGLITVASNVAAGTYYFTVGVDNSIAPAATQAFTLTVNVAANNAKDITAFSIGGVNGTISGTNIAVTMPYGTNKANLTPAITHTGASVSPASGVAQDFTNPVTYTVTAQDGSTQVYTVTVRVQPPPSPLPKTGDGFPLYELLALLGCCLTALGLAVTLDTWRERRKPQA